MQSFLRKPSFPECQVWLLVQIALPSYRITLPFGGVGTGLETDNSSNYANYKDGKFSEGRATVKKFFKGWGV